MLSRSAKVKLKAILIIDVIVIAAAAGAYFYLQNQGLLAGAKPAKFALKALAITPNNTTLGDAVQISVNVTNVGNKYGNTTLNFEINSVVESTQNVTLAGGASQILQFTEVETTTGVYNVTVGDLSGTFKINPPPPGSSFIVLSNIYLNPDEAWPNQTVTVDATAQDPKNQPGTLPIRVTVDNVLVQTEILQLNASETEKVQFAVNATTIGIHTVGLNTLTSQFSVVKSGYHTLTVGFNGAAYTTMSFTLNGNTDTTPFTQALPVGQYTITVPNPLDYTSNGGTNVWAFAYWDDGLTTAARSFDLNGYTVLFATYTLISGVASCPSLFVWNGTGNSYVTDVCNAGWLGYMGYMTSDGSIVYLGGNPWDYVKLDKNLLAIKDVNGSPCYDMTLIQQWDELFYLDAAYMLVVDHPVGTDVYTTMSNYENQAFNDQIYTVNQTNIQSPVSATYVWGPANTDAQGENVLPQISKLDGVFTPGNNGFLSPSWNNPYLNQLTLNLGDLSNAKQIKLIVNGIVNWGEAGTYYSWVAAFQAAAAKGLVQNGTQIYPAPYMEVKDANGNWIPVSATQCEMPTPSDYNARTFVVDLTGIFPKGISDYQLRILDFFNVTYDYIGIDTSTQQNITVQKISPIATLSQLFNSSTTSSGNFTRYGDVTALLQSADNMYVIGRQGDQVTLEFPTANLTAPAPGMERDYFLIVACWFKDPPGNWGYGFNYTVDPLPFIGMSGFPYPPTESYPYDAAHLAYLNEYNTRVILPPATSNSQASTRKSLLGSLLRVL